MTLQALAARGHAIGARAAIRAREDIAAGAALPRDVRIETGPEGVILSGRRLRRRMIDDTRLRNFTNKGQIL